MLTPLVSVVMAVYNGQPHLSQALESILGQGLDDFEFIVVDDASTDGSADLLAAQTDKRLRVLTNASNQGLSRSLNRGLEAAQGQYIARMDHDDLSLDTRLATQAGYLDVHAEVDVLGTWARTIGLRPEQEWRLPLTDAEIRAEMLFHSVLVHSSVMWRRSSFERNGLRYDEEVERAQDYDLWVRAAAHVQFSNLGKVLHHYRLHDNQVGAQHSGEQQRVAQALRLRQLQSLGLEPSPAEQSLHKAISTWDFPAGLDGLQQVENWLLKLRSANQSSNTYKNDAFDRVLERIWWAACSGASRLGPAAWNFYQLSPLSNASRRGRRQRGRFWAKAHLAGLRR